MSSPPLRGDRSFRDDIVRIAELTVNTSMLENYEFSNCRFEQVGIAGPSELREQMEQGFSGS
jgi:hypothetical protein